MKLLTLATFFSFYLFVSHAEALVSDIVCLPNLINKIPLKSFEDNIKHLNACQQQTQYIIANKLLNKMLFDIPSLTNSQKALLLSYQGDIYLLEEEIVEAKKVLDKAKSMVENTTDNAVKAHVYNSYANFLVKKVHYSVAEENYKKALDWTSEHDKPLMYIKIYTNLIKLSIKVEKHKQIKQYIKKLFKFITYTKAVPTETKLHRQVVILELLSSIVRKDSDAELLDLFKDIIISNLQLVKYQNLPLDNITFILAYGYLGEFLSYPTNSNLWKQVCKQATSQYHCAKKLLQQTVFKLKYNKNQEITYYWEWKYGQLLEAHNEIESAKKAYIAAIDSLQAIKTTLLSQGSRDAKSPFKRHIEPIYKSLVKIYLQQRKVISALEVMEKFNNEKLQAFYSFDNCTQYSQNNPCFKSEEKSLISFSTLASHLEQDAAFFYPIFFKEYIKLIIILPLANTELDIRTVTANISRSYVEKQINILRNNIESKNPGEYQNALFELGKWLIEPIHSILQKQQIKTLIVVPESNMYMIPISTLIYKTVENGNTVNKRVLSEYATVVTPSLSILFDNNKNMSDSIQNVMISLNGLSKKSAKFPEFKALPHVEQEIQNIKSIFNVTKNEILLNENFSSLNMGKKLTVNEYRMIHIASHGKFSRNPLKTFILTNNEKLDLNRFEWLLKRRNKTELDLLTLSACETAKGDNLAAFGLAGIAYKTGAKSVLATLWPVDDKTTADLMTSFYEKLKKVKTDSLNKAQILQKVQQEFIEDKYPADWASFILIGNWK
ncbi:MAG: CHAT domain-containing protein [Thiotrichaceae bacterium]|nr:CHAT domain-containing protein [Thiotrichaceae bacterium]